MCTKRCDTREKILETAGKLFAEAGFTATSMDDIAQQVGVTKSTLYHHFESKQELLEQILIVVSEELKKNLTQAVAQAESKSQALRMLITKLLEFTRRCPEMHIFTMIAVSDLDRRAIAEFVIKLKKEMFTDLRNLVIKIDPFGDGNTKTATLISFTILGMVVNLHVSGEIKQIPFLVDHLMKTVEKCKYYEKSKNQN